MTLFAAIVLAQAAASLPAAAAPCSTLCDAAALSPFFARLAEAWRGRRTVRIVQIGDSHTAGDQVTGSWRTLLQRRYGNAGRGVLPPGRPYPGYLTRGITATQSAGWSVDGIFGASYHAAAAAPLGLTGYSLTGAAGATMSLAADAATVSFDRFTVCALRRPGAGTLTMTVGGVSQTVTLDGDGPAPVCTGVATTGPAGQASVTIGGGPVTLTSWATEAAGKGGVLLSNLGTVGAQLVHFGRTADAVVAAELDEYRPDLIVVAFGTNEAFVPGFSAATYDAALRAGLARVRRLAPGVPILLLGAPDSATRYVALQRGEGGMSAPCGPGPAAAVLTAPEPTLDQSIEPLAASAPSAGWLPTAALPTVQAIQRRVAHATGAAFWDWSMRMGGRCTANAWARAMPPLMRADHVHFTTIGAAEIARRLQDDLDAAMAADAPPAR